MTIQKVDNFLKSSLLKRTFGIIVCLWITGVIIFAGFAAYEDGIELYRWTMLGLLLIGLPFALFSLGYATILLGSKGRKTVFFLIIILFLSTIAILGYEAYQSRFKREALTQDSVDTWTVVEETAIQNELPKSRTAIGRNNSSVRLRLLAAGAMHYTPLSGISITIKTNGLTLQASTDKNGWASFEKVPCESEAIITAPDFELQNNKKWLITQVTPCLNETFDLGTYSDLSGKKLQIEDFQYILK